MNPHKLYILTVMAEDSGRFAALNYIASLKFGVNVLKPVNPFLGNIDAHPWQKTFDDVIAARLESQ